MSEKSGLVQEQAEKVIQNIRRSTSKRYSGEEKIRVVLEGLRGEDSIAELMLENRLLKKSMTVQTLLAFAGETTNEIPCLREAGNHPAGPAVAFAGQAHAGQAWHSEHDLFAVV